MPRTLPTLLCIFRGGDAYSLYMSYREVCIGFWKMARTEVPQGKGNQSPKGVSRANMNFNRAFTGFVGTLWVRASNSLISSRDMVPGVKSQSRPRYNRGLKKNMKYRTIVSVNSH